MDLNYDSGFKEEFAPRFFYYYPVFIANSYLPSKINPIHVVLSTVSTSSRKPTRILAAPSCTCRSCPFTTF
jgi:hypothetical protein